MAVTAQERTNLIKLTVGIFNAAPGATYINDITTIFEANGRSYVNTAIALSTTAAFNNTFPASQTSGEFATTFLTTLGLQANAEAIAYVTAQSNANTNRGKIIADALIALEATTSPSFADAKNLLNNKTSLAQTYSLNAANNSTDLATLRGVVASATTTPPPVAPTEPTGVTYNVVGTAAVDNLTINAAGDNVQGLAGNDTITNGAGITALTGTINGGDGTDVLNLVGTSNNISAATVFSVETLVVAAGSTTVLTLAQHNAFTTITSALGAGEIANLTTSGTVTLGARAADTNGFDTINLGSGADTVTFTGAAAVAQVIAGGAGNDTFTTTVANMANRTLSGGDGTDTLSITDALTGNLAAASLGGFEVINLAGLGANTVTGANGAGVTYNVGGLNAAGATVTLGTGGQAVNSTGSGVITLTGNTGADTFTLGAAGETITGTGSNFAAIDTVNGFKAAGADIFKTGTAAVSVGALTIATAELATLAANIQTATTTGGNTLGAGKAYQITVTAGGAAGVYLYEDLTTGAGTTAGSVDSGDFIVRLTGTSGTIFATDIIV